MDEPRGQGLPADPFERAATEADRHRAASTGGPGAGATAAGLVAFGRVLGRAGVQVTTTQLVMAGQALGAVDAADRHQVCWALRAALLTDRAQAEAFDRVFEALWTGEQQPEELVAPGGGGEEQAVDPDQGELTGPVGSAQGAQERAVDPGPDESEAGEPGPGEDGDEQAVDPEPGEAEPGEDDEGRSSGASWSAAERLRRADIAGLSPEQERRVERLAARLGRNLPPRMARRSRAGGRAPALDPRATLRKAMRTEAHPLELAWRAPRHRSRNLVFLIDISGSMEAYARPMLTFAGGARRASRQVEVFVFGTRLTRLSGALERGGAGESLAAASAAVPDWAGGTRIGESLERFNRGWGRRGMTRGAVVTIFSDGWERGEMSQLDTAMQSIRGLAHAVIWVNPLAGDPGYEPLAAGMSTALRHVDLFLPGRSLEDLEQLTEAIGELPPRRLPAPSTARKRSRYDVRPIRASPPGYAEHRTLPRRDR